LSDADEEIPADIRRVRALKRMLRESGYVRDVRDFCTALGVAGAAVL